MLRQFGTTNAIRCHKMLQTYCERHNRNKYKVEAYRRAREREKQNCHLGKLTSFGSLFLFYHLSSGRLFKVLQKREGKKGKEKRIAPHCHLFLEIDLSPRV